MLIRMMKLCGEEYCVFLIEDDLKWYEVLKNLILNKDLRDNVSEKLNQYVKDKFGMEQSAKKRIEFYKNLCDEKLV